MRIHRVDVSPSSERDSETRHIADIRFGLRRLRVDIAPPRLGRGLLEAG